MPKLTTSLFLVASALFLTGCNLLQPKDTTLETTADASPQPVESNTTSQELMAAFQRGASLSCSMTNSTDGAKVTFVTKDKKHKTTSTAVETPDALSYTINDGEYMYIWTSNQTTGFKTRIPTAEEIAANQTQLETFKNQIPDFTDTTVQQEYANKGYSFDCQPTTISDSEFVPPTTVQFQDMSVMMEKAMQGLPKNITPPDAE